MMLSSMALGASKTIPSFFFASVCSTQSFKTCFCALLPPHVSTSLPSQQCRRCLGNLSPALCHIADTPSPAAAPRTRRRGLAYKLVRSIAAYVPFPKNQGIFQAPQIHHQHQHQHGQSPAFCQLHTHQLLHLVERGTLADLHGFGCLLGQEQIPGRTTGHIAELKRITSELKAHTGQRRQQQHHFSMFEQVVQTSAARKLEALHTFQHSVAAALSRARLGAAVNPACSKQQQQQQQQQQESPADSSVSMPADVVVMCEALLDFKQQVDAEAARLPSGLQRCTELSGWWDDTRHVDALNTVMDEHEAFTLSARLLISEYLSAWAHWQHRNGRQGIRLHSVDNNLKEKERWSMAGPAGPPGYDPHAPPRPLINQEVPLIPLLQLAAEDTRAFCIEKFSTAPEVRIVPVACLTSLTRTGCLQIQHAQPCNAQQLQEQPQPEKQQQPVPVILAAYVEHVFTEICKNAMQSLLEKWGAWDVDEAEPILVEVDTRNCASPVSSTQGTEGAQPYFLIRLTDTGGGIPLSKLPSLFHYFGTTHAPREATYTYSRDFGAQFQGQGVGAPLSRLYARFMGGHMQWALVRADGQELPLSPNQVAAGGKRALEVEDTRLNDFGSGSSSSSSSSMREEIRSHKPAILGTRVTIKLPCNGFSF